MVGVVVHDVVVPRRAALLFLALGVAWGIPYLLIKVAVDEISPAELVLARTGLAALILLPIAIAKGAVRPLLPYWHWMLFFAGIEIAGPWVLLGSAETQLPSSTTGLLIAAVPLAGLAIAFATGHAERLAPVAWLGLALGIIGVVALVGLDVAGSDLGAVGEVGLVVIGYAAGPAILSRALEGPARHRDHGDGPDHHRAGLHPDRAGRGRPARTTSVRQGRVVGDHAWRSSAPRPPSCCSSPW